MAALVVLSKVRHMPAVRLVRYSTVTTWPVEQSTSNEKLLGVWTAFVRINGPVVEPFLVVRVNCVVVAR